MIPNKSYTSDTRSDSPADEQQHPHTRIGLALAVILLLGAIPRLLRLDWQPLWWDEGYSVYFATEPLPRMAWLTAHDIHPPLYYASLHGWINLLQSSEPPVLRLLSVLFALPSLALIGLLAAELYPGRPRVALLAALMLSINPMHLFYSQELRMYGLALTFSLAASISAWIYFAALHRDQPATNAGIAYWLFATLSLYTLYYSAFLLLAQWLWAIWRLRNRPKSWLSATLPALASLIVFLPWLVYTAPKLIVYVADKVRSDQDTPLDPLTYLWRHLAAFTSGHVQLDAGWFPFLQSLGVVGLILLLLSTLIHHRSARHHWLHSASAPGAHSYLWTALAFPALIAYAINLRYPFFPEGGERLLLFLLPYALLLAVATAEQSWLSPAPASRLFSSLAALVFIVAAMGGSLTFALTPRYVNEDYRPLIRQVIQNGRDEDTVLALFPWQVGYWRAYAPRNRDGNLLGPQPPPLDQQALEWNQAMIERIEHALANGSLWFPAPVAVGSTLPQEIEDYLVQNAANLENQWFSPTTRLSAWVRLPDSPPVEQLTDFGPLKLSSASVSPAMADAANQPVAVTLVWHLADQTNQWHLSLRLRDDAGRVWARREHEPLGIYADGDTANFTERLAFRIPAGLPPGQYTLTLGVSPAGEERLLQTEGEDGQPLSLIAIQTITVTLPPTAPHPARLPIAHTLQPPVESGGITILGTSGEYQENDILAGTLLPLTLHIQNNDTILPARHIYASLLDQGTGVAGWEGWPLNSFSTNELPPNALLQLPASFYLPATLPTGSYTLIAGFIDPATNEKFQPAQLGSVRIQQRMANFSAPSPTHLLSRETIFGSHVRLLGYDLDQQGKEVSLILYWQVIQSLLPPHAIFVHAAGASGPPLAQDDGPPHTSTGEAPTGSWQPGEYLATVHHLTLPETPPRPLTFHAGLYEPETGRRLPVTIGGEPAGDFVTIGP